ncbi:MAG: acetyltransferase [Eubacteriales bacterium]|nr:acetyltransferase [Eubacteriales bacterium]
MKKIVLYGAGGFGRETAYLIERINQIRPTYELLGFIVDDSFYRPGTEVNGYPVLGTREWMFRHKTDVFCSCTIGEPKARERIQQELEEQGVRFESLVSPDVEIHDSVEIGDGAIIAHGVLATVNIRIGKGVVLNGGTTLGHDVVIGDYSCIMGGCGLTGNVNIGKRVRIGGHAFIVPHVTVGDDAVIAAGSIVFTKVKPETHVLGNPARRIKL